MTGRATARPCAGGFTLIELVVVLILVGILAMAVAPRFSQLDGFDAAGYSDQLRSILRYGQKAAVAQRRNVGVTYSASAASLCSYTGSVTGGCAANCAGGTNVSTLALPGGKFRSARSASVTAGTLCFDATGKPYDSGGALGSTRNIGIVDGGATVASIRIAAETGYVH